MVYNTVFVLAYIRRRHNVFRAEFIDRCIPIGVAHHAVTFAYLVINNKLSLGLHTFSITVTHHALIGVIS